ncbi:MAG: hypothetical protein KF726_09990, partial [Anaerolineae bacterium]|nr:hypothetical protein [Anaerolineae bacterium]
EFPAGTAIYLEAYYRSTMMRFKMGTLRSDQILYWSRGKLTELQDPIVNFRIKLVDETEHIGRLVGVVDHIQTFNRDSNQVTRVGLLPVKFDPLADQIWKLNFDQDGTDPVLSINDNLDIPDIPIAQLVRQNPIFLTLVFPHVVRQILERIAFNIEDNFEAEDQDHWSNRWKRYGRSLVGTEMSLDDEDAQREWIESVVQAFCAKNKIKEAFESYIRDEKS